MFRLTIKDVAAVAFTAVAAGLMCAVIFALDWWRNSSYSRVGNLRRGLEQISKETSQRDREIDELTTPYAK